MGSVKSTVTWVVPYTFEGCLEINQNGFSDTRVNDFAQPNAPFVRSPILTKRQCQTVRFEPSSDSRCESWLTHGVQYRLQIEQLECRNVCGLWKVMVLNRGHNHPRIRIRCQ